MCTVLFPPLLSFSRSSANPRSLRMHPKQNKPFRDWLAPPPEANRFCPVGVSKRRASSVIATGRARATERCGDCTFFELRLNPPGFAFYAEILKQRYIGAALLSKNTWPQLYGSSFNPSSSPPYSVSVARSRSTTSLHHRHHLRPHSHRPTPSCCLLDRGSGNRGSKSLLLLLERRGARESGGGFWRTRWLCFSVMPSPLPLPSWDAGDTGRERERESKTEREREGGRREDGEGGSIRSAEDTQGQLALGRSGRSEKRQVERERTDSSDRRLTPAVYSAEFLGTWYLRHAHRRQQRGKDQPVFRKPEYIRFPKTETQNSHPGAEIPTPLCPSGRAL